MQSPSGPQRTLKAVVISYKGGTLLLSNFRGWGTLLMPTIYNHVVGGECLPDKLTSQIVILWVLSCAPVQWLLGGWSYQQHIIMFGYICIQMLCRWRNHRALEHMPSLPLPTQCVSYCEPFFRLTVVVVSWHVDIPVILFGTLLIKIYTTAMRITITPQPIHVDLYTQCMCSLS